jgi:hypothetical protein
VHLGWFGPDKRASCVSQVDDIESSLGWRVSHCQGMIMYVTIFDLGD